LNRAPSKDWPRLLTPAPGCFPPAAPLRRNERVLHLALYPGRELHAVLSVAFNTIASEYVQIDHMQVSGGTLQEQQQAAQRPTAVFSNARDAWNSIHAQGATSLAPIISTTCIPTEYHQASKLPDAVCAAAATLKPTIVFMHMQTPSALDDGNVIAKLRSLCDPSCVIVQWDGDLHYSPSDWRRQWFINLGALIDASLTSETHHQAEYAAAGVKHPGFLEVGVPDHWEELTPPVAVGVPPVVLLASRWAFLDGYDSRDAAVSACGEWYGPTGFGVFGNYWDGNPCARPYLTPAQELGAYREAKAALCMSIRNDVTRYTSDRLLRALYAGAVVVAERFPDCEGLGLENGVNCLLWSGLNELNACLGTALAMGESEGHAMRAAAAALGREHTWCARVPELLAIIDAIREERLQ
jgi:hypothetical protein